MKNFYNLHFTTIPGNQFSPMIPHIYFSTKFRTTFIFIGVFTIDRDGTCSTITKNSPNHVATSPKGHIGYIEKPRTIEKPKYYQGKEINDLVHNVACT